MMEKREERRLLGVEEGGRWMIKKERRMLEEEGKARRWERKMGKGKMRGELLRSEE